MKKTDLRTIMQMAWQFVKRNGFELSEALKQAWQVFKLKKQMLKGIVKFYYQKVAGISSLFNVPYASLIEPSTF